MAGVSALAGARRGKAPEEKPVLWKQLRLSYGSYGGSSPPQQQLARSAGCCWSCASQRILTTPEQQRQIQKYTKQLEIQTQNQTQSGAVAQATYFDKERRRKEAGYPDSRTRLWWPEMNLERILNCSNYPSLSLVAIYSSYSLCFLYLSPQQAPLVLKSISWEQFFKLPDVKGGLLVNILPTLLSNSFFSAHLLSDPLWQVLQLKAAIAVEQALLLEQQKLQLLLC